MKQLYLTLSFFALFFLDFYLKTNISGIGEKGVNLPALGLFIVLSGLLFLWRASSARSIVIRRSTFLLLLFLAYFIFRIGIDIGSIDRLKEYIVATTSGVLTFYILGLFVAIILGRNYKNSLQVKRYFKFFTLFFIGYLIISYTLLIDVFFDMTLRLRTDILLIEDPYGAYQRPGNFLAISYLILITLYAQFISLKQRKPNFAIRAASVAAFGLFIFYTLTSLLIAQMIGSNNATVLIGGLGVIVVAILMLLWFKSSRRFLTIKQLTFTRLTFGKVSTRLIVFGVLALVMLIGVILSVASYLGIDLTMTRLGGFGSGEVSSVSSRLALLDNFALQFSYSPLFGNMNVDCLTTGCGSYVHSLLATLLTHTGLLGFFLFAFYILIAYKERFKLFTVANNQQIILISNIANLTAIMMVTAILLIAIVATSMHWAVLWFALGLFFVAFDFS
ncbi:MAG: hypothetical protein V9G21_03460 [Methylotenera sp.]|nr:hypothetical protein [Methylotenera sp.]